MEQQLDKNRLYTRWGSLKSERASWMPHWKELNQFILPRSGRFFVQDRNKGNRRHNDIYDNTATKALRIMGAGMMSGATSPARPWFKLETPDPDLNKNPEVKQWLADVTRKMLDVFGASNTYLTLHGIYEDLGVFGTATSVVMSDFDNVIHHYPVPVGEFALAADYRGNVNTMYREFQKTVDETVREFGYENCSLSVRNQYDRTGKDNWVTIVHAIEPRDARDTSKLDGKNKAYRSVYFELGSDKENAFLRDGGFDEFNVLAPRWNKYGSDIYGSGPGMDCLGDIKQLQHEQLRKANAIDYQTKPPLQVPTSMKNSLVDTMPGGITFVDSPGPQQAIRSAWDVNLNLSYLLQDIQDVRERIRSGFFADLFLMIANGSDTAKTATEIAERHEEKMLMLGPVLERLHTELLNPLVEMTFAKLVTAGALPPPPQSMQGMELNVVFVSMLAQAQRAIQTNGIDRFVGNIGMVAQYKPDVLDKFDADQWADIYSDSLGIDPSMIVANDKVALIRQQRAQAQQQAAMAERANQMADSAAKLGSVPSSSGQGTMANDMLNAFSGYGSPSAVEI